MKFHHRFLLGRQAIALSLLWVFVSAMFGTASAQVQIIRLNPVSMPISDFFSLQNSARDFFETGREQLEQEILILERQPLVSSTEILTIDAEIEIQDDLLPLEPSVMPFEQLPLERSHF